MTRDTRYSIADNQTIKAYYEGTVEPIYRAISGPILHLGMFEGDEPRHVATTRTKEFLAARLPRPLSGTVLDLGSGYGDTARFLAQRCSCRVIGLNLLHNQNVTALGLNRQGRLEGQIRVIEGDFARVPLADSLAQVVWSQESLLHAPQRGQVLGEAARLLISGGLLIFSDILQTAPMAPAEASAIYARVKVNSLETFERYQNHLRAAGLRTVEVADLSRYVAHSYQSHVNSLRYHRPALVEAIGAAEVDYTITAMERWVKAAEEGKLGWGMFVAQKP
jgi:sarcosine/dimethylglycine N-methyltransferase